MARTEEQENCVRNAIKARITVNFRQKETVADLYDRALNPYPGSKPWIQPVSGDEIARVKRGLSSLPPRTISKDPYDN